MDTSERHRSLCLSFGLLGLTVAMLLWRGPVTGRPVEFATGLLVGLSTVLNDLAIVGAAASALRASDSGGRRV